MISLTATATIILMMLIGAVGGFAGGIAVVIASLWLLGHSLTRGDDD